MTNQGGNALKSHTMKKNTKPTDIELIVWEGAYKILKNQKPEMLRLVSTLIAEGQTPAQIFNQLSKKAPAQSVLPALCSNAADWLIYQSKKQ